MNDNILNKSFLKSRSNFIKKTPNQTTNSNYYTSKESMHQRINWSISVSNDRPIIQSDNESMKWA